MAELSTSHEPATQSIAAITLAIRQLEHPHKGQSSRKKFYMVEVAYGDGSRTDLGVYPDSMPSGDLYDMAPFAEWMPVVETPDQRADIIRLTPGNARLGTESVNQFFKVERLRADGAKWLSTEKIVGDFETLAAVLLLAAGCQE